MSVDGKNIKAATYTYDSLATSIDKDADTTVKNQEHETKWYFVYGAYSHRYKKASFFIHFNDRDVHFTIASTQFYSNYHALYIGDDPWNNKFPGVMKKF